MLTGLQDMKDHKTELKNLSEPAGRVILQNKASVCNNRTCGVYLPWNSAAVTTGWTLFFNQNKDTAHYQDDTASPNSPDHWAGGVCSAEENSAHLRKRLIFLCSKTQSSGLRRFWGLFSSAFLLSSASAILNSCKVGREFSSSVLAFLPCIHS